LTKITVSGHIVVPTQDLPAVREALVDHIALTRSEEGCIVFDVTEHTEQLGRFEVYEEFVDSDAFAAHQARVKESHWGKVATNVSRHYSVDGLE